MKQNNGRIWFEAGIDRTQLTKGISAINKDFAGLRSDADRTGQSMSGMWKTAATGLGAYLTAQQALAAGSQIINLTKQRELMEKSFEVLFGGVDEAKKKITEINEYAIFSPYTFDGVAKAAQTMTAFGVATEDIMPTLRIVGDVAAGNAQRFESLALVYGQVTSAGRLMGQDLLQFINAGFNPLQIISEQTGKSMLELKKSMEEGAISADMVKQAFVTATSEGGKFYQMTTKMSESIEAAASTFESAWVEKQIEWGKNNAEMIKSGYELGTSMVENIDEIAKAFGVLISTVGAYKASLIAVNSFAKIGLSVQYAQEAAALQSLIGTQAQAANADVQAALAKGRITEARAAEIVALRAEATAKLETLRTTQMQTAADAKAAADAVIAAKVKSKAARVAAEQAKVQLALAKQTGVQANIDRAQRELQIASERRLTVLRAQRTAVEVASTAQTTAQTAAIAANTFATNIDTAATGAAASAKGVLAAMTAKATAALHAMKAAFASNPIGLIITLLTTAASAWYLFKSNTDKATESQKAFNDLQNETKAAIEGLISTIQSDTSTMTQRVEAYEELKLKSKGLTDQYSLEELRALALADAQKVLNEEMDKQKFDMLQTRVAEATDAVNQMQAAYDSASKSGAGQALPALQEGLTKEKEALAAAQKDLNDYIALQEKAKELATTPAAEDVVAVPGLKEQLNATAKGIAEIEQKIKDVRSGKIIPTNAEGEVISASNALTQLEDQLSDLISTRNLLLGYDPDDIKLDTSKSDKIVKDYIDAANKKREIDLKQAEDEKAIREQTLKEFQTYEQKRASIVSEYAKKRALMFEDEDAGIFAQGFDEGNLVEWSKSYNQALTDIDAQAAQSLGKIADIWNSTANKTGEEIQSIIEDAERLYTALSEGDISQAASFGISEDQFKALQQVESVNDLRARIDELRDSAVRTTGGIQDFTDAVKALKIAMQEGDGEAMIKSIEALSTKFSQVTSLASSFAEAIANIGDMAGSDTFSQLGDGVAAVTSVLSETMSGATTGAAVGGPIGAAIGGAIGLLSSVTGVLSKAKKEREKLKAELEDTQREQFIAEYEINQLYRERYDWAKKIGESELQNAKRVGDEIRSQMGANSKEQDELLAKLYQEEYKRSEKFVETGLFGWGKGKIETDWATLAGKSWEEIEKIAESGKLSEEGWEYYEALKAAKGEGEDIAERQIEYMEQLRELTTGSSYQDIVESAMDSLINGTKTAGQTFDDIMHGAVESALDLLADEKLREWYEGFATAGQDGYTEEEIAYWKALYEKQLAELERDKDAIEEATGVSFGGGERQGQASAGDITTVSQETGAAIDGKMTALMLTSSQTATNTSILVETTMLTQILVVQLRDAVDILNSNVRSIEKNVRGIKSNTDALPTMATDLKKIKENTAKL